VVARAARDRRDSLNGPTESRRILLSEREPITYCVRDRVYALFPYDRPYENQRRRWTRIHNTLGRGQNVLFEGACGTGKTLSSLVPALEVAREQDKTVVITTSVHQQNAPVRRRSPRDHARGTIRAVVFKGKSSMCHIDVGYECQALRDNTRALVDTERDREQQLEARQRELLAESQDGDGSAADARNAVMDELEEIEERLEDLGDQNVCDYYRNNLTKDTDDFFGWLFEDVRTPDEIYEHAEGQQFCGYELLKEGIEGVDLVVCNYHHLLDSTDREQFFRWLGRDPDDVIAVFDEAHNVGTPPASTRRGPAPSGRSTRRWTSWPTPTTRARRTPRTSSRHFTARSSRPTRTRSGSAIARGSARAGKTSPSPTGTARTISRSSSCSATRDRGSTTISRPR